jgi:hypothetical protein
MGWVRRRTRPRSPLSIRTAYPDGPRSRVHAAQRFLKESGIELLAPLVREPQTQPGRFPLS